MNNQFSSVSVFSFFNMLATFDPSKDIELLSSMNKYLFCNLPIDCAKVKWDKKKNVILKLMIDLWLVDSNEHTLRAWGIISLFVPGKTGAQCYDHYVSSNIHTYFPKNMEFSSSLNEFSMGECMAITRVVSRFNSYTPKQNQKRKRIEIIQPIKKMKIDNENLAKMLAGSITTMGKNYYSNTLTEELYGSYPMTLKEWSPSTVAYLFQDLFDVTDECFNVILNEKIDGEKVFYFIGDSNGPHYVHESMKGLITMRDIFEIGRFIGGRVVQYC